MSEREFYNSEEYSLLQKLYYAIEVNDLAGLQFLVTKYRSPDKIVMQASGGLMSLVYEDNFFEGGETLIKFGLPFIPEYVFLIKNDSDSNLECKRHLEEIKSHIYPRFYQEAHAILTATTNNPIVQYKHGGCLVPPWVLANHTYSDDSKAYSSILSFEVKNYFMGGLYGNDSFRAVGAYSTKYGGENFMIVSPSINHISYSTGYMAHLHESSNKSVIYFPFKEPLNEFDHGVFIHELSHCAIDKVFQNKCNPFPAEDVILREQYLKTIKEVTKLVFSFFNGTESLSDTTSIIYNQESVDELKLEELIDVVTQTMLGLFRVRSISNNDNYIEFVSKNFLLNYDQDSNIEEKRTLVLSFYDAYTKKYSLSDGHLEILDRIAECYFRPPGKFESEFIVRLPELKAKGINSSVLEYAFMPLIEYWKANISPAIERYSEDMEIKFCGQDQEIISISPMGDIEDI